MANEHKIILRKSIENLGVVGDVVVVKAGYARNFLIPQQMAFPVTKENLRRIDAEKERIRQEELRKLNTIKSLGELLSTTSITIEAKAEDGHLFGSVTAQMITDVLRQQRGIEVHPKSLKLENPLKEIGVYDITVHLHPEVEVVTKVWIVEAR